MKIYVVLSPEDKFLTAHKFMTDVAYHYNLNINAIRMQFSRKGYYNKGSIRVIRIDI
jgi:hypothetical protein